MKTVKILPYLPGAFEMHPVGGFLVGDVWPRKIYQLGKNDQKQLADLSGIARFCLSDAVVATQCGIFVGDAGFDFLDPLVDPVPNGIIVHIQNGGQTSLVAEDLFFPNGMVITPDERTLIVAEAFGHMLTAFDIRKDGALDNRRLWAQLPDDVNPDGICLDSEGAIWVATTTPRALRVLEGGQVVDEIIAEQAVFAVMLGGPQRSQLFLCTSASSDPVITRRKPSATIEVASVNVSGVSVTHDEVAALRSISQ